MGSHPVIDLDAALVGSKSGGNLAHPDADRSLGYRDQHAPALPPPAGIGDRDGRAAFTNYLLKNTPLSETLAAFPCNRVDFRDSRA